MKHLYRCHDEVWCDKLDHFADGEPTPDPLLADCQTCLVAAENFGGRANLRLAALENPAVPPHAFEPYNVQSKPFLSAYCCHCARSREEHAT